VIIEGDFINPEFVKSFECPEVKSIFVNETDVDQIVQNYLVREGGDLQHYRAKISIAYGKWIVDTCNKYGLRVIESRPWETVLERTIVTIMNSNRKDDIMKKIGFIGVGVMGKSMVRNLMKQGFEVSIYARTKEKVEDVLSEGAIWCETIAECVKEKAAVITIVGYPKDVEEVYFSEEGILHNATEGTYLIDMTTTSPKLSVKIYEAAKERGLKALDAPVSGGDIGAKKGTLSIMVGGEEEDFTACKDIFEAMGTTIVYEGKPGNGQHTKMANQIALAGTIAGVCEAMAYAKNAGLEIQTMLDSISKGAAGSWQMTNMAPKMLKGDFAPGFFIKHMIKDLDIAVEEAESKELELGVLEQVLSMYRRLEAEGKGDLGTQALCQYFE